ncbi:hypothetical protein DUI87_09188 [Hirundo rustica rustica]|uniref:Uncharacterized protein n=1 Tax=Hirundo rustica rustica TaxID=333673 RepID=A0A3M0KTL5_HIRRU|nr:hypothetical protein DUI87_09188 [Hirundo rustica rustica]
MRSGQRVALILRVEFRDCKHSVIRFIAVRSFPETLYYVLLFCDWDMWKDQLFMVKAGLFEARLVYPLKIRWVEVDGESESKAETAEGDEVVVFALAVGLAGWIHHSPEEN